MKLKLKLEAFNKKPRSLTLCRAADRFAASFAHGSTTDADEEDDKEGGPFRDRKGKYLEGNANASEVLAVSSSCNQEHLREAFTKTAKLTGPDLQLGSFLVFSAYRKPFGANCQRAVQKSDVLSSSTAEPGNSRFISGLRYTWASQTSLLWRNPWMQTIFHQRFFSSNKSRRQESSISDEDKDELTDQDEVENDSKYEVLDEQHISDTDDSEVLDEQQISDSEDDAVLDEEYVSDDDNMEESQSQVPAKKKFEVHAPKVKPENEGPILNEKITAKTLRLVDDEGKGHRVLLRDEALYLAKKKKMDLVMVDKKADPPVCKIFDFNRTKYQKEQTKKEKKKKKGAAAKLSEVKELRYSTKTELKDLKMKVDKAKEFLERGYKVKFVANFQAYIEEMPDRLEQGKMIHEVISMMDDIASIEQGPRFEARLVWVMFKHIKFGKPKKKAPKVAAQAIEDTLQTETDGKYEFASLKV